MGSFQAVSGCAALVLLAGRALAQAPAPSPPPAAQSTAPISAAPATAPGEAPSGAAPASAPPIARATAAGPPPAGAPAVAGGQWMLTPEGRYTWVPAGYELPPVLPYEEGQPIPTGYHLEERPRRGAVITGYLLTGIPYGMGLVAAFTSNFANESKFLALPWVGPWLTLGFRESKCDSNDSEDASGASDALGCVSDAFVVTALLIDGILQAVGGTLLLTGYAITKQELVRDGAAFSVSPGKVGSGRGLVAAGAF